jgi:hypothetical protein
VLEDHFAGEVARRYDDALGAIAAGFVREAVDC